MKQAGAIHAPDQYPGDAVATAVRDAGFDAAKRIEWKAKIPSFGRPGEVNDPFDARGPGASFEQRTVAAESSGIPGSVNAGGYSGLYQFGAPRLKDLGAYTPAPGEVDQDGKWKTGKMAGTFNIPGFPQVRTQADFLASPEAQRSVFAAHVAEIDRTIAATPGADRFNRDGLRAVAHLGGTVGLRKFVASGGQHNAEDLNGTTLRGRYDQFSRGGAQALKAAFGPPDRRPEQAGPISLTPPSQANPPAAPLMVRSDADYMAVPSGQTYVDPAGHTRRKR
jgi:hypothetical protein